MRTIAVRSRSLSPGIVALLALAAAVLGCAGDPGPIGPNGTDGTPGTPGMDGIDGMDGDPGVSPVVDQNLSPIDKAFVAIGGKTAVQALSSFTIDTAGTRWVIGETHAPEDPPGEVSTFKVLMNYDLGAKNLRLDYHRDINFLGFNTKTDFSEILLDKLGYINGTEHIFGYPGGDMLSDRWASTRKQQRLLNPHLILRDVAADPTLASDAGVALLDGSVHHLVEVKDKTHPVTLFVNVQTGTIDKAMTTENDQLERDIDLEVFYYGWKPAGAGLLFPSNVYLAKRGEIVHQEARSSVTVNGAIDPNVFMFPGGAKPMFDQAAADRGDACHQFHQSFASFGIPLDGEQTFVMDNLLAPNVHYLTGGSHNSIVVEQANGLVLIEAPLYEARSEAIIAWAKGMFPNKPFTYVIATHFHTDHAGGLRRFVAEGATMVVGEATAGFFRGVFKAPSTILPDKLALSPKAATVITVPDDGFYTIPDAQSPVAAYHLQTGHAAGMLMGYLPTEKIVFNSDLFNPASPPAVPPPFMKGGLELYTSITMTHKLAVDSVAGGHGALPNTFVEFKTALGL
jgi:glyoxylase-like metal-dependent hydrolase (beta-lactamase superfamily II)